PLLPAPLRVARRPGDRSRRLPLRALGAGRAGLGQPAGPRRARRDRLVARAPAARLRLRRALVLADARARGGLLSTRRAGERAPALSRGAGAGDDRSARALARGRGRGAAAGSAGAVAVRGPGDVRRDAARRNHARAQRGVAGRPPPPAPPPPGGAPPPPRPGAHPPPPPHAPPAPP